jgi:hypothetical protein
MFGLLGLIFGGLFSVGANWYETTFMSGISAIPSALLSFLLSYLAIQFFFFIFPPLKKMMMVLGAPFRYLHVWLHIDAARRIEINKYGIADDNPRSLGFWGSKKGSDTTGLLHPYFNTTDALKVASAPLYGAGALFLFLIFSAPIFAGMGSFGLIFHIYLIFGCFGIAFPSLGDYSFLVNGNSIRAGGLHPGYVLWAYFVFAISGYISIQRGTSGIAVFRDSILFTLIYLLLLLMVSRVSERKTVTG